MKRVGAEGIAFPIAAGAAAVLCIGALGFPVYLYEQDRMRNDQVSEFESNPAVFAITRPDEQPTGKIATSWDRGRYDGTSHFTVKIDGNNMASISDPYQSVTADGPRSGAIVSCSSLDVDVAFTHNFEMDGKSYRAIVTKMGNAAVCSVAE